MTQAFEQSATPTERRVRFLADARAAREEMLRTGKGYDADEVHAYLKACIAGRKPVKPEAKPWRG